MTFIHKHIIVMLYHCTGFNGFPDYFILHLLDNRSDFRIFKHGVPP
jgi:hypothetical protein